MARPKERQNNVTATEVRGIYDGVTEARKEIVDSHKSLDQVKDEIKNSPYRTLTLSLTEGAVDTLDKIAPRGTRSDGKKYSKKQIVTDALMEYLENHYSEHESIL
jgi:hypothetical protein